jgi:hypothetical protein
MGSEVAFEGDFAERLIDDLVGWVSEGLNEGMESGNASIHVGSLAGDFFESLMEGWVEDLAGLLVEDLMGVLLGDLTDGLEEVGVEGRMIGEVGSE